MKIFLILIFLKFCVCKIQLPSGIVNAKDAIEAEENRSGFLNFKTNFKNGPNIQTKVTGGTPAKLGQFPYQALIYMTQDQQRYHTCGGSLITFRTVLTAAHCVQPFSTFNVYLGTISRAQDAYLEFGETNLGRSQTYVHKKYNSFYLWNDIALIYLRTATPEILKKPNIGIIALPNENDKEINLVGKTAVVSGFGVAKDGQGPSNVLNFADLKVLNNDDCHKSFGDYVTTNNICFDGSLGISACSGDSGGPVVTEISPGRKILIGIVSFGRGGGCEQNYPSVMTKVSSYLNWIETHKNSVPNVESTSSMSPFAIAGIVVGVSLILIVISLVAYKFWR